MGYIEGVLVRGSAQVTIARNRCDTAGGAFIGREAELALLQRMFAGGRGLVTLVGAPGIGKTRLARELAATDAVRERWSGPPIYLDLAACEDAAAVAVAIADALGGEVPAADPRSLARALAGDGGRLVVLDGLEHLLPLVRAIAEVAADMTATLLCSREALGLPSERCVALGGLSATSAAGAGASDAAHLLRIRADAAGFVPCPTCDHGRSCESVLAALARELDDNPLAIELAAPRLRLMCPSQLLDRLDQRLEVLSAVAPASGSLESRVDASWRLLTPVERAVFAQLCVFDAPVALCSAEQVIEAPAGGLLDALDALVRKSLVTVGYSSDAAGRALSVSRNLRAYGRKRLLADGALLEAVTARHARWAAVEAPIAVESALGHAADGPFERSSATQQRSAVAVENLLVIGTWAIVPALRTPARIEQALAVLIKLRPLLVSQGMLAAAIAHLEAALEHSDGVDATVVAHAQAALGEALYRDGRGAEAAELLSRAREAAVGRGDDLATALLLHALGASRFYGRVDVGRADLEEALAALTAAELHPAALDAQMRIARCHEAEGNAGLALESYADAIARARAIGDDRRVALGLLNRGALLAHLGRTAEAVEHYRRVLARGRQLGDRTLEAVVLCNLGIAAFELGDADQARERFEDARKLGRAIAMHRVTSLAEGHLGLLAHGEGAHDEAEARYRAALEAGAAGWSEPATWSLFTLGLGLLRAAEGHRSEAQRLLERVALIAEERTCRTSAVLAELMGIGLSAIGEGGLDLGRERAVAAAAGPLAESAQRPRAGAHELRAALGLFGAGPGEGADPVAADAALIVARDGQHFRLPDGPEVHLGRRKPARLVLRALATAARERPGGSLTVEELYRAGWPGENVRPPYRANRVYVVVADLRKLGLDQLLLNDGDGYQLSPATPVRFSD